MTEIPTYEVYETEEWGRQWSWLHVAVRVQQSILQAQAAATALRVDAVRKEVISELDDLKALSVELVFDLSDEPFPDFKIRWEQIHRTETATKYGDPEVMYAGRHPDTLRGNVKWIDAHLLDLNTPSHAILGLNRNKIQRVKQVRFERNTAIYHVPWI
jgi:hypothetical protein